MEIGWRGGGAGTVLQAERRRFEKIGFCDRWEDDRLCAGGAALTRLFALAYALCLHARVVCAVLYSSLFVLNGVKCMCAINLIIWRTINVSTCDAMVRLSAS